MLPGCAAAAAAVDGHAHFLQSSRGRPRKHTRTRRSAVRRQSSFARGCVAADCGVRPADSIPDFRGHLQSSGDQAVCRRSLHAIPISSTQRPRDLIRALHTASDAIRNGEIGLHFRRRRNHAHRTASSIPPWIRTHHAGRGGADHSREPRRSVGQHFQLRGRALSLEISTENSLPGFRGLRQALPHDATPFQVRQSVLDMQSRAFHHRRARLQYFAIGADSHRAPASVAICDGRCAAAASALGSGAAQLDFPRAAAQENLGGPGNGGRAAAAFRAGRDAEFCGDARGQNSRESELHVVERNARLVRRAMQAANDDHTQVVAR